MKSHAYKEHMIPFIQFLGESYEPLRTQDLLGDTYAKKWKPEYIYKVIVDKAKLKTILLVCVLKISRSWKAKVKSLFQTEGGERGSKKWNVMCDPNLVLEWGKTPTIKNHPGISGETLNIDCRFPDFGNLYWGLYKIMSQFLGNIH